MLDEYHIDAHPGLALRPTQVLVDAAALSHNARLLGERCGLGVQGIMAVVKANGYGHGLLAVSRTLLAAGVRRLAVGFLEEAVLLRREGVRCPILVLGGLVDYQIESYLEHQIEMTVSSLHKVEQVAERVRQLSSQNGLRARVHLKIDTGMERIGVHPASAPALLEGALQRSELEVCGVYSHLANAVEGDAEEAQRALNLFKALRARYQQALPKACIWHLASSAAAARWPHTSLDCIRPGIMLYGIDPAGGTGQYAILPGLKAALAWHSAVVYFKVVEAGSGISYGHQYHTPHRTRLITIPVGYGDGYRRALGDRAEILVRGQRCPVRGRVCMDQIMADLGPVGTAYNGDEVVLVGRQGPHTIALEDLANWMGGSPYEILTGISDRVPRRLVPDMSLTDSKA